MARKPKTLEEKLEELRKIKAGNAIPNKPEGVEFQDTLENKIFKLRHGYGSEDIANSLIENVPKAFDRAQEYREERKETAKYRKTVNRHDPDSRNVLPSKEVEEKKPMINDLYRKTMDEFVDHPNEERNAKIDKAVKQDLSPHFAALTKDERTLREIEERIGGKLDISKAKDMAPPRDSGLSLIKKMQRQSLLKPGEQDEQAIEDWNAKQSEKGFYDLMINDNRRGTAHNLYNAIQGTTGVQLGKGEGFFGHLGMEYDWDELPTGLYNHLIEVAEGKTEPKSPYAIEKMKDFTPSENQVMFAGTDDPNVFAAAYEFEALLPYLTYEGQVTDPSLIRRSVEAGTSQKYYGMYGLVDGVMSWLNPDEETGIDNILKYHGAKMQATEDANAEEGLFQKFVGDVIKNNVAQFDARLASTFTPVQGFLMFVLPASGQYMQEAKMDGATMNQAMTYGAVGGAVEGILEMALGWVGYDDLLAPQLTTSLTRNFIRSVGKAGLNTLGEGIEEGVANPVMALAGNVIYSADNKFDWDMLKETLYEAGVGMGSGAATGGVALTSQFNKMAQQTQDLMSFYANTLMIGQSLPSNYASNQLTKMLIQDGMPISENDMARLLGIIKYDISLYAKSSQSDLTAEQLARFKEAERQAIDIMTQSGIYENMSRQEYIDMYTELLEERDVQQAAENYADAMYEFEMRNKLFQFRQYLNGEAEYIIQGENPDNKLVGDKREDGNYSLDTENMGQDFYGETPVYVSKSQNQGMSRIYPIGNDYYITEDGEITFDGNDGSSAFGFEVETNSLTSNRMKDGKNFIKENGYTGVNYYDKYFENSKYSEKSKGSETTNRFGQSKEIISMSPNDFIAVAEIITGESYDHLLTRKGSKTKLKLTNNNRKFNTPVLDMANTSIQGIEDVVTMLRNGVTEIPVVAITGSGHVDAQIALRFDKDTPESDSMGNNEFVEPRGNDLQDKQSQEVQSVQKVPKNTDKKQTSQDLTSKSHTEPPIKKDSLKKSDTKENVVEKSEAEQLKVNIDKTTVAIVENTSVELADEVVQDALFNLGIEFDGATDEMKNMQPISELPYGKAASLYANLYEQYQDIQAEIKGLLDTEDTKALIKKLLLEQDADIKSKILPEKLKVSLPTNYKVNNEVDAKQVAKGNTKLETNSMIGGDKFAMKKSVTPPKVTQELKGKKGRKGNGKIIEDTYFDKDLSDTQNFELAAYDGKVVYLKDKDGYLFTVDRAVYDMATLKGLTFKPNTIDSNEYVALMTDSKNKVVGVAELDKNADIQTQNDLVGVKEFKHKPYDFDDFDPNQVIFADNDALVKSLDEIQEKIRKYFKVGITSTRVKKTHSLGTYWNRLKLIKEQDHTGIGVTLHELGHHLDYLTNLDFHNNPEHLKMLKEIVGRMSPEWIGQYKADKRVFEAVAEFFRYYMTMDEATTREFGGAFYEVFEQMLKDHGDFDFIQEIRGDVRAWLEASIETQIETNLWSHMTTPFHWSYFTDLTERARDTRVALFDENYGYQIFVNFLKENGIKVPAGLDPYKLVNRALKSSAIAKNINTHEMLDPDGNVVGKSLADILRPLRKGKHPKRAYKMLNNYLVSKRAIDYWNRGKFTFKGVNNAQAELYVKKVEKEHPEITQMAEQIWDYWRKFMVLWGVNEGYLSMTEYEDMVELDPHYVPYKRFMDTDRIMGVFPRLTGGRGLSGLYKLTKRSRLHGGAEPILNPIESIMLETERIVTDVNRRRVMLSLDHWYRQIESGQIKIEGAISQFMARVSPKMAFNKIDMMDKKIALVFDLYSNFAQTLPYEEQVKVKNFLYDANGDIKVDYEQMVNFFARQYKYRADQLVQENIDDVETRFHQVVIDPEKHIVSFKDSRGKVVHYEIFDVHLLDGIIAGDRVRTDMVTTAAKSTRRLMQLFITSLDVVFALGRNPMRDIPTSMVYGDKNPFLQVVELMKMAGSQMVHDFKWAEKRGLGQWANEYRRAGGPYSSPIGASRDAMSETMEEVIPGWRKTHPFRTMFHLAERVTDAVEQAPRMVQFKYSMEHKNQNESLLTRRVDALYDSMDVTVNFSRRGKIMNIPFAQIIPFFNPGLQGIEKTFRMHNPKNENFKRTVARSIAFMFVPAMLLYNMNKDDEYYHRIPQAVKDTYWLIPTDEPGVFIQIPKPHELGFLWTAPFERAMDELYQEDADGFDGFMLSAMDIFIPSLGTVIKPWTDAKFNTTWYGGSIVPRYLEDAEIDEQYDERTSKVARMIAKFIPDDLWFSSPMKIDYLMKQYMRSVSEVVIPATDEIDDNFLKEFLSDPFTLDVAYTNELVGWYYDAYSEIDKAMNTDDLGRETKNPELLEIGKGFFKYNDRIKKLRKVIEGIESVSDEEYQKLYTADIKAGFKTKDDLIRHLRFAIIDEMQEAVNLYRRTKGY